MRKNGDVVVSSFEDGFAYASDPTQLQVHALSTDALNAIGLEGPLLDASVCDASPVACFRAGDSDATFQDVEGV